MHKRPSLTSLLAVVHERVNLLITKAQELRQIGSTVQRLIFWTSTCGQSKHTHTAHLGTNYWLITPWVRGGGGSVTTWTTWDLQNYCTKLLDGPYWIWMLGQNWSLKWECWGHIVIWVGMLGPYWPLKWECWGHIDHWSGNVGAILNTGVGM